MAAAASDEMIAATDVADLLVRRGVPFRAVARDRGRRWCARRSSAAGRSRSSRATSSRELAAVLDDEFYDVLAQRVVARVQGLGGRHGAGPRARAARPGARACSRGSRRDAAAELLRPPGAGGRARPRRLRRAPRRRRPGVIVETEGYHDGRAGLPRLRRPHRRARDVAVRRARAAPTSTARTASTRCSTRSASRRASAPRC